MIPHSYKARKLLKIEDLLPEVFSVIESIDECLIPLVPPEDDVTKDVNVEIGVNLLPGQEKCDFLRKCVSESHLYQYLLSDMLHLTMKLPLVGTSVTNVAVLPLHIGRLC